VISAFNWLLTGIRSWTDRVERQRRYDAGLQLAKMQAANAEDAGDAVSADFWNDVAEGIRRSR
jgi:hypothetical protein